MNKCNEVYGEKKRNCSNSKDEYMCCSFILEDNMFAVLSEVWPDLVVLLCVFYSSGKVNDHFRNLERNNDLSELRDMTY